MSANFKLPPDHASPTSAHISGRPSGRSCPSCCVGASRVRARPTEENKLQVEPGPAEMVRQRPVVVAGCFEPDPNRQVVAREGRAQSLEVFQRVHDRQAAAACFAGDADQHFMAMLGNVDGDQQGRRD